MSEIRVTQRDIDASNRPKSLLCPLERALHRAGWPTARVGTGRIYLSLDGPGIDHTLQTVGFINAFDDHKPVKPQTFDLALPQNQEGRQ